MKWILALLIFTSAGFSFGMSPPDSTSTIFEKGTAKYLISEGKRFYNEGSYRMSLVKFREALNKDKGNAEATYWLAECHLALGNYEKAKDYVQNALAIDEEVDEEARNVLAICQHRIGELDEAIKNYKLALAPISEII